MVVLSRCSFVHEAYLIKANLESAGIQVEIRDEHTVNMDWFYSNALGGVKVLVNEHDLELAQSILEQDYSDEVDAVFAEDNKQRCSHCGSVMEKAQETASLGGTLKNVLLLLIIFWPIFFWLALFRSKDKQERRPLVCPQCDTTQNSHSAS